MRIVYVDDDPEEFEFFREALHKVGTANPCTLTELNDSRRLFEVLEADRPELIFVDLNMPVLGGKQLLSMLKDECCVHRAIPVVIYSSSIKEDEIAQLQHSGAFALLNKQADLSNLAAGLRRIFEKVNQQ